MSTVVLADHQSQEDIQLLKEYALEHLTKVKSSVGHAAEKAHDRALEKKNICAYDTIRMIHNEWLMDMCNYGKWIRAETSYGGIMTLIIRTSEAKAQTCDCLYDISN